MGSSGPGSQYLPSPDYPNSYRKPTVGKTDHHMEGYGATGPRGYGDRPIIQIGKPAVDSSDTDAVIIPGESDVRPAEYTIGTIVELCCPICQAPMTARLESFSMNEERAVTKQEYVVTDKPCDCPFIVLECLPFRGGVSW
jgi:hypothetical protein